MTLRKPACAALVVGLVLLALSGAARAESGTPAPGTSKPLDGGIAVYLFAGHAGWNTTALDARLASLGYSSFSQNPGSGGLGMRGWIDACGCMGDMEFQFSIASAAADEGRQLSLTSGQFVLHAGRILYARGPVRTYAMLGVGYGSTNLTVNPGSLPPRSMNPLGFADGLTGATTYALTLQALVGVDYLVHFPGKTRGFNGVLFGLRAGYNLQPVVSSWTTTNGSGPSAPTTPVNLPAVAADGGFVHLVFGDVARAK